MAVVSALFTLVIVPSAMATETAGDVNASIGSGEFSITASGAFTNTLNLSLPTPPVADTSATSYYTAANDYFTFIDGTANQGGMMSLHLDGDFVYSDTGAGVPNIAATQLNYGAAVSHASNSIAVDPVVSTTLDSAITARIVKTTTAATAENINLYSFNSSFSSGTRLLQATSTLGNAATNYFASTAANPMEVNVRLEKLNLVVPGGSAAGAYHNIIHVVISDGEITGL